MFLKLFAVVFVVQRYSNEKQPSRAVPWKKCSSKFIEITLQHECSPVNLLHIFRTHFPKNTSEWLLLSNILYIPYSF